MSAVHEASTPLTAQSVSSAANILLVNVPCDPTVYVGAAVRMSAGTAYNALADSVANSNFIGVVQRKASATLCDIRVLGVTPDIFVGLDETQEYFLSDTVAGEVTTTPAAGAGHVIVRVGQPYSATKLLVVKGQRIVLS